MTIPKLEQRVEIIAQEVDKLKAEGGETIDAYTKAEADAKFETITGAASKYIEDETTYFTLNGIRVYVSSTAPTGTIPEGSIGLGW